MAKGKHQPLKWDVVNGRPVGSGSAGKFEILPHGSKFKIHAELSLEEKNPEEKKDLDRLVNEPYDDACHAVLACDTINRLLCARCLGAAVPGVGTRAANMGGPERESAPARKGRKKTSKRAKKKTEQTEQKAEKKSGRKKQAKKAAAKKSTKKGAETKAETKAEPAAAPAAAATPKPRGRPKGSKNKPKDGTTSSGTNGKGGRVAAAVADKLNDL